MRQRGDSGDPHERGVKAQLSASIPQPRVASAPGLFVGPPTQQLFK